MDRARYSNILTKGKTTYLPVVYPELTEALKEKAKKELFESDEKKTRMIEELKRLLREEKNLHFPEDDDFLLQFLRARKFDVQRALTLCKKYFLIRKNTSLYRIADFNFVQKMSDCNSFGFLPYRDADGCVIFVFFIEKWNPSSLSQLEYLHSSFYALMLAIRYPATQVAGFRLILDYKGFSYNHILALNPQHIWNTVNNVQDCLPGRLKSVHVVNQGKLFSWLWSVVKVVMKNKFVERCHFHGRNIEEIHKTISPAILPEEFGGELGPFENKSWQQLMKQHEPYFTEMNQFGYKEC